MSLPAPTLTLSLGWADPPPVEHELPSPHAPGLFLRSRENILSILRGVMRPALDPARLARVQDVAETYGATRGLSAKKRSARVAEETGAARARIVWEALQSRGLLPEDWSFETPRLRRAREGYLPPTPPRHEAEALAFALAWPRMHAAECLWPELYAAAHYHAERTPVNSVAEEPWTFGRSLHWRVLPAEPTRVDRVAPMENWQLRLTTPAFRRARALLTPEEQRVYDRQDGAWDAGSPDGFWRKVSDYQGIDGQCGRHQRFALAALRNETAVRLARRKGAWGAQPDPCGAVIALYELGFGVCETDAQGLVLGVSAMPTREPA